jgi:uncharacterized protein
VRLFLDANIAFSAALTNGAVRRLLHDLKHGGHILVMDDYVWEEARRNLIVHRSTALQDLHNLTVNIEIVGTETGRFSINVPPEIPEKDLPVINSAAANRCDILVTGDRTHFGSFYGGQIAGITVLSPRMAAERFSDLNTVSTGNTSGWSRKEMYGPEGR